jgi:hypothetical protein
MELLTDDSWLISVASLNTFTNLNVSVIFDTGASLLWPVIWKARAWAQFHGRFLHLTVLKFKSLLSRTGFRVPMQDYRVLRSCLRKIRVYLVDMKGMEILLTCI